MGVTTPPSGGVSSRPCTSLISIMIDGAVASLPVWGSLWGQHSGTLLRDFAVLVLVLWVGLETSKSLNLDVKITFAGSHTGDGLRDVRFPWASH